MRRRIKLTIAYDGTDFHGWQVQPGRVTIQSVLQEIFAGIEKRPVEVSASGRTDAGVHAFGQTAAVTIVNPIPVSNLKKAVNRLLPHSIRILRVEEVHAGFHPRYDAVAKTYEYRIFRHEVCPPFERRYVHHHPYPLDVEAMIGAARLFTGEHDFSAFAAADEKDRLGRSKVRRIFYSELVSLPDRLVYRVRGSGFLKHMVRNLVGTLIEVGKGNMDAANVAALLADGGKCGATAPACGLSLVSVEYPDGGGSRQRQSGDPDQSS